MGSRRRENSQKYGAAGLRTVVLKKIVVKEIASFTRGNATHYRDSTNMRNHSLTNYSLLYRLSINIVSSHIVWFSTTAGLKLPLVV